jgi:putative ATP-binding cassette transporter
MPSLRFPLLGRFLAITRPFFQSEARWGTFGLIALILVLLLGVNALNVFASFKNRDFMTAVEQRAGARAVSSALLWVAVVGGITVVAVFKAFTEERLRLRWRDWLTQYFYKRYLTSHSYYRMKTRADLDNPDQRITEDVRTFTEQALALFLIITNSTVSLISFAGILWSITPWLFVTAVLWTVFGSLVTIVLGRRLMKLDVKQFRKEADLRYDLIQVRSHGEQIALLGGEPEEKSRLGRRLAAVVDNMRGVIGLSRNISFFTTGYDNLNLIIPLLIVAPLYIQGKVEFGMITQAGIAFGYVMGAFSLIVKEFQRISTFGAVIERLGTFSEVLDQTGGLGAANAPGGCGGLLPRLLTPLPAKSPIEIAEDSTRVAFERLTLTTPREGRLLVKDLSVEVLPSQGLLVLGPTGSGRTCLLRAAAGLWTAGQGRVVRPTLAEVLFLPQQPYFRTGTLREQLLYGTRLSGVGDERIQNVIAQVGFETALERVGGMDRECDWSGVLSLGEQQQLAIARLLLAAPRFAFLDEATSALEEDKVRGLYELLNESPIAFISVSSDARLRDYHDQVVELYPDGTWSPSEPLLACA